MIKGFLLCFILVILAVLVGALLLLHSVPINALQPASHGEEAIALRAREYLISRDAAQNLPPQPPVNADGIDDGHTTYGASCAGCHGYDGRTPTKLGSAMFPRVPSLAAPGPQHLSDAEIYVSIQGGIRHSGMPGFGPSLTTDQIWHLVQFIRTLPAAQKNH
jgi:mono/diheme cytochrome c family protein